MSRLRRSLLSITVLSAILIVCGIAAGIIAVARSNARSLYSHPSAVEGLAFAPSGDLVASAGGDKLVRLWTTDGFLAETIEAPEMVRSVSFSDDGELIAIAGWGESPGGFVRILSTRHGNVVADLVRASGPGVPVELAFAPGGRFLGVATNANVIELLGRDGSSVRTFPMSGWPSPLAFSPSGKWLAVVSGGNKLQVFEVATGRVERDLPLTMTLPLFCADDDQLIACWNDNRGRGGIRLYSTADGSVIRDLSTTAVWARPALDPTGTKLAVPTYEGVELRDVKDGSVIESWSLGSWPNRLAYSPRGDVIAVGGADGCVRFVTVGTGKK